MEYKKTQKAGLILSSGTIRVYFNNEQLALFITSSGWTISKSHLSRRLLFGYTNSSLGRKSIPRYTMKLFFF